MSKCVGYDITIWLSVIPTSEECIAFLQEWCKKWVFVHETCPKTGTPHFQCRVHLKVARTLVNIKNLCGAGKLVGNWSVTSKDTHAGEDFNYVLKSDTLVEGPFKSEDVPEVKVVTEQLRQFLQYELRPYQKYIFDECSKFDMRTIDIIYDELGHCGKSQFVEYLHYKGLARQLPPMNDIQDIMGAVMCMPTAKAYLIDMPRGMKKDKLGPFYAGIESLKNGYAYDKRFKFQEKYFDRPRIFVFTNTLPEFDLLSHDRWHLYRMDHTTWTLHRWEVEDARKYKRRRVAPVEHALPEAQADSVCSQEEC